MAITPQAAASLAATIDEEIRDLKTFVELLRQEQVLLSAGGNGDALMPLIGRKSLAATRLKVLSDRRDGTLTAAGLPAGRSGMEAWLAKLPQREKPNSRWQELLVLAAEARQLNEINGKLIGLHWQHNQAALTALMSAADCATTYGPDGQQRSGGGGRSFGSA